ncbi:MAG: PhoH family protein [Alphaproteobacteria bacterium GM7ARS4]|nr:PhoH family protein [Alphaproteobacteria bacterium GM7ARS4]
MALAPTSVVLSFEDIDRLALLCGVHDAHLVCLEKEAGVSIYPKGNTLSVVGEPLSVAHVVRALQRLYGALASMGGEHGVSQESVMACYDEERRRQRLLSSVEGMDEERKASIRIHQHGVVARRLMQARYMEAMARYPVVFAEGPAGTGKTYLSIAYAASMLVSGDVERIVLSRPAVEAGERLGFLPGDMKEKVDPYLRPLYDALNDMMSPHTLARYRDRGMIEVAPLAFMRGRTLRNAFIILDEAQNTTPIQMKMFLTRLGEGSHMVIAGDASQVDSIPSSRSGLTDALEIFSSMDDVKVIHFTERDSVRHPLVQKMLEAYGRKARQANMAEEGRRQKAHRGHGEHGEE